MTYRNGVGDVLEEHRLTGTRRRHDQTALTLADRSEQVHHATGVVFTRGFKLQPVGRIQRRQVVEEDLVPRLLRRLKVDSVHLDEREVPFAFFRWPNLS